MCTSDTISYYLDIFITLEVAKSRPFVILQKKINVYKEHSDSFEQARSQDLVSRGANICSGGGP